MAKQSETKAPEEVKEVVAVDNDIYGDEYRAHHIQRFKELLDKLSAKIPADKIRSRIGWKDRQGKEHYVEYIEWVEVADILDRLFPKWEFTIRDVQVVGEICICVVSLTIDGVTREGIGVGEFSEMGVKGSASDGLKRAAVLFGVGRELYRDEPDAGAGQKTLPQNPLADSDEDLASPAQQGLITRLGKEKRVDPEEECGRLFNGARTAELSKKGASALIDYLKALTEENKKPASAEVPKSESSSSRAADDPIDDDLRKAIWDKAVSYYKDNADAASGLQVLFSRKFGKNLDIKKMTNKQGEEMLEDLTAKLAKMK